MINYCVLRCRMVVLLFFCMFNSLLLGMQWRDRFDGRERDELVSARQLLVQGESAFERCFSPDCRSFAERQEYVCVAGRSFDEVVQQSFWFGFDIHQKNFVDRLKRSHMDLCARAAYKLAAMFRQGLLIDSRGDSAFSELYYLRIAADCHHEGACWQLYSKSAGCDQDQKAAREQERATFLSAYALIESPARESLDSAQLIKTYHTIEYFYVTIGKQAGFYDAMIKKARKNCWNALVHNVEQGGIDKVFANLDDRALESLIKQDTLGEHDVVNVLLGIKFMQKKEWEKARFWLGKCSKPLPYIVSVALWCCSLLDPKETVANHYQAFLPLLQDEEKLKNVLTWCPASVSKRLTDLAKKEAIYLLMDGLLRYDEDPEGVYATVRVAMNNNDLTPIRTLAELYAKGESFKKANATVMKYYLDLLQADIDGSLDVDKTIKIMLGLSFKSTDQRCHVILGLIDRHPDILHKWLENEQDYGKERWMLLHHLDRNYRKQMEQRAQDHKIGADLLLMNIDIVLINEEHDFNKKVAMYTDLLEHAEIVYNAGYMTKERYGSLFLSKGYLLRGLKQSNIAHDFFVKAAALENIDAKRELAIEILANSRSSINDAKQAFDAIETMAREDDKKELDFLAKAYSYGFRCNGEFRIERDSKKAYGYCEKLLKLNPDDHEVEYQLAKLMYELDGDEEFTVNYGRMYYLLIRAHESIKEFSDEDYAALGISSYHLGNYSDALGWFDKAPNLPESAWYRALIYYHDGRLQDRAREQECVTQILNAMRIALTTHKTKLHFPLQKYQELWKPVVQLVRTRAYEENDADCKGMLARLAFLFTPEAVGYTSTAKIIEDLQQAVAANNAQAKVFLGFLYTRGTWVDQSLNHAIHCFCDLLEHNTNDLTAEKECFPFLRDSIQDLKPNVEGSHEVGLLFEAIYRTIRTLLQTNNRELWEIAVAIFSECELKILAKFLSEPNICGLRNTTDVLKLLGERAKGGYIAAGQAIVVSESSRFVKMLGSLGDLILAIQLYEAATRISGKQVVLTTADEAINQSLFIAYATALDLVEQTDHNQELADQLLVGANKSAKSELQQFELKRLKARHLLNIPKKSMLGIEQLTTLATLGVPTACLDLAKVNFFGTSSSCTIAKDPKQAIWYLFNAIRLGSWEAEVMSSRMMIESDKIGDLKALSGTVDLLDQSEENSRFKLFFKGLTYLVSGDYQQAYLSFSEHFTMYHSMASGAFCAYALMKGGEYGRAIVYLRLLVHQKGLTDWYFSLPLVEFVFEQAQKRLAIVSKSDSLRKTVNIDCQRAAALIECLQTLTDEFHQLSNTLLSKKTS